MLTELRMELDCEQKLGMLNGSLFQGVMMEQLEKTCVENIHQDGLHPYAQHLEFRDKLYWVISVTNKDAYKSIIEPLLNPDFCEFTVKHKNANVKIVSKQVLTKTHKELMESFYEDETSRYITLDFVTPTSFKSNGCYVFIPTSRLIFGSLMRKYSSSVTDFDMSDEDTLDYIDEHSSIVSFKIKSLYYPLESITIPAFVGSITIKFTGTKTMMSYASKLAEFGEYSGVGVKCGMGMGAMKVIKKGERNSDERKTRSNCSIINT